MARRRRRKPVAVPADLINRAQCKCQTDRNKSKVAEIVKRLRRAGARGDQRGVDVCGAILRRYVFGGEPIVMAIEAEKHHAEENQKAIDASDA